MTKIEEAKNINDAIDIKREVAKYIMKKNENKTYDEASTEASKILNIENVKQFSTFDIRSVTLQKQEKQEKVYEEVLEDNNEYENTDFKVRVLSLKNDKKAS